MFKRNWSLLLLYYYRLIAGPSFNRNTITESYLLRYRGLWAPSLMNLSPTSPPASPTCYCTPTWPCGPVYPRDHSCLITPLQSSLQKHRPRTQISGLKDKMNHTLDSFQHTHRHPPHNPRNLHIVQSLCRTLTQHLLNQFPLHRQMSLYLHICQFRQCSQNCPHRLTYTV